MQRFKDPLHPDAKDVLTFDFSPGLQIGETLTGAPTLSINLVLGMDPSPSTILQGGESLDPTATKVYVPVKGNGIDGCDYAIECKISTTNPKKQFAITAVLSVRT